jgi:hypothetical protein
MINNYYDDKEHFGIIVFALKQDLIKKLKNKRFIKWLRLNNDIYCSK